MAAIPYPDLSHLQVVGGFLLFAGLFVLRKIASGALKEVGKDLWSWAKSRCAASMTWDRPKRQGRDGAAGRGHWPSFADAQSKCKEGGLKLTACIDKHVNTADLGEGSAPSSLPVTHEAALDSSGIGAAPHAGQPTPVACTGQ